MFEMFLVRGSGPGRLPWRVLPAPPPFNTEAESVHHNGSAGTPSKTQTPEECACFYRQQTRCSGPDLLVSRPSGPGDGLSWRDEGGAMPSGGWCRSHGGPVVGMAGLLLNNETITGVDGRSGSRRLAHSSCYMPLKVT